MLRWVANLLAWSMGFIRWVYFLRFSLALWLFPLVLVGLNKLDQTLTSGILIPEFPQGYLCVGFFLVSSGFAALISARVSLINGPERWDDGPAKPGSDFPEEPQKRRPTPLDWLLVNDKSDWEWLAVVVSIVPAFLTGLYLKSYGRSQYVATVDILVGLLVGALLAGVVWYVANVWYYFTYDAPEGPTKEGEDPASTSAEAASIVKLGATAARTILYPRAWLFLTKPGESSAPNKIESADTLLTCKQLSGLSNWLSAGIITVTGQRGYGYTVKGGNGGKLYEAQIFAIIAMFVFFGHYLLVWPMVAPVPSLYMSIAALGILLVAVILATVVFWSAVPKPGLLRWKIGLTLAVFAYWAMVCGLYVFTSAERFPIFAIVLIMAISAFWTLGGIAFFVDRYRVPVFTTLLLLMLLPRLPHLSLMGGHEEHYFSTISVDRSKAEPVPTPAEILNARLIALGPNRPLIVVTATGGGLHASAWTAAVLARLEDEFVKDPHGTQTEPFHKHLLMLSTVSGGSVGLSTYLRELHAGTLDQPNQPGIKTMQIAAQCSSLEAVGWGLVYYDLPKALVPLAPYVLPLSSGNGDMDGYNTPLFKDRTWALRKGIERNEDNRYCSIGWDFDLKNDESLNANREPQSHIGAREGARLHFTLEDNLASEKTNREDQNPLTLRAFLHPQDGFPAFTMNTTSVERGNRFLLANYRVPHYSLDDADVYPAQSFLDSFGACSSMVPDLPLATAAQLSATFPYVSSASRAPGAIDCQSVHFVDGGYYDNDGTGSALEFLRYALAPPQRLSGFIEKLEKDANEDPKLKDLPPCDPRRIPAGNAPVARLCDELLHLNTTDNSVQKLGRPLRILWIEIRNSGDYDGGKENTPGGNGASADRTNLLGQLGAVPEGFWNAGHESVTGRTRVALGLMELAFPNKLQIHRIVIADSNSKDATKTDPLNWSLTPRQRWEVRNSAGKMDGSYQEAKRWFYDENARDWDASQLVSGAPGLLPVNAAVNSKAHARK